MSDLKVNNSHLIHALTSQFEELLFQEKQHLKKEIETTKKDITALSDRSASSAKSKHTLWRNVAITGTVGSFGSLFAIPCFTNGKEIQGVIAGIFQQNLGNLGKASEDYLESGNIGVSSALQLQYKSLDDLNQRLHSLEAIAQKIDQLRESILRDESKAIAAG